LRVKRDSWFPTAVPLPGEDVELPLKIKTLDDKEGIDLRARYRVAENATEEEKAEYWCPLLEDSFRRFVRIEGEFIIERDGVEVKIDSAEKLIPFYGGEIVMLNTIFFAILLQSGLTPLQKKVLRSAIGFKPSSEEPSPEAPGTKPETTATSAEPEDSAASEDASSPETPPSGSTEAWTTPSSSTNAPFVT